ncbi:hypothetical protein Glove_320g17 [Diversispora epigaea]|uniref:Uncharacterized protein n=1 Tax=Diversispora epigaea TaxID=1348612 RepID=A0A397HP69_9GLOM|nr:hypothetical protein Glove_320g17 [Diversispora epigaea]
MDRSTSVLNGETCDCDYSNIIYTYNYPTSKWFTPVLYGDTVPPRQNIKGVIDDIYIW